MNKLRSIWWQIFRFFILWFVFCVISYAIVVLPFYPEAIQLSQEKYADKITEGTLFSILINVSILIGTLSSMWYVKQKVEKTSFGNFYRLNLKSFVWGSILGIILILLCAFFMALSSLVSFTYLSVNNVPFLILIFIVVAVSEEVIFRGYLLNKLSERLSVQWAVIISSLMFSLLHIGNSHFGIIGFTNIFLSGMLLAMVALKDQNLWVSIGLHFTWNLTQAILGFAVSGHKDVGLLKLNHLTSLGYLSGGAFGVEGSLLLTPIIVVAILLVRRVS